MNLYKKQNRRYVVGYCFFFFFFFFLIIFWNEMRTKWSEELSIFFSFLYPSFFLLSSLNLSKSTLMTTLLEKGNNANSQKKHLYWMENSWALAWTKCWWQAKGCCSFLSIENSIYIYFNQNREKDLIILIRNIFHNVYGIISFRIFCIYFRLIW